MNLPEQLQEIALDTAATDCHTHADGHPGSGKSPEMSGFNL